MLWSRSRPEPPFLAGAGTGVVKKRAAPAPAQAPALTRD